ncbi:MAG: ABC transporter substrate-binding protein [Lachnospiraceae bacterium]|nr:ABC transporter substrate-binding protein [Lachnospiraceae bacterium]
MKKKIFATILAVTTAFSMMLTGCGNSKTEASDAGTAQAESKAEEAVTAEVPETTDITFYGVNDPQISAALIMADKLGYFEELGLNVQLQLFTGMDPIGAALSSGEAKIATSNNYEPILWVCNGAPIHVVAPLCNMGGTQAAALAPGVEIESAKDLENLRIGLQAGSPVTICFKNMCAELGVDFDSLNFINLQPADQISAMASGDIDVISAWEPYITQVIHDGGTFLLSGNKANFPELEGDVDWFELYNSVVVNDEFLAENPVTVKLLLQALGKATDYINDNREETVSMLAVQFNLEEDVLSDIMDRNYYDMIVDDQFVTSTQYLEQYLFDNGFATKKLETSDYINFDIMKSELSERYVTELF